MRKLTNSKTVEINGLSLPINTHDGKYFCYVEPLEKIKREMDSMLYWHNKVFMFRLEVHVHEYTNDNEVITNFIRSFRKWALSHYNMKRVGYVWCREVEKAKKQHYHLMFMMDGNKVRTVGQADKNNLNPDNRMGMFERIEHIASIQNLTVSLPEKSTYMVKRNKHGQVDYKVYKKAFERVSYLAKERGKKLKGERANSFQTSRIKCQKKQLDWVNELT